MNKTTSTELPVPLVETEWLADHLDEPDLRILDCSVVRQDHDDGSYSFASGQEVWQQEHIPNSIFVDILTELSDPDHPVHLMMPPVEVFAGIMADRGVGDGTRVVLYDDSNHAWAARVWWMLRTCGFDNAAVLNGGKIKWRAEGRPTSEDIISYPAAAFTSRPRLELMADKETVLDAIGNCHVSIINALSPQMFNSELVLFPRPGRIPGSSNVYCSSLVNPETMAYVDREQMRKSFEPTGALTADKVITYCGGGIAASSDALALTLLGVKNIAVYDGSMAEWTADPDLPLEV